MKTLEAEFGYCTSATGCDVITNSKGLIVKILLLTEAVVEEAVIRYESPLSKETAYTNDATPATAAAD
jgi:hypothetical protein